MKRLFAMTLLAAAIVSVAQQQKPQLSDKDMRFAMWFAESSTAFPDKSTITFEVSGRPVHGFSRDQNLEFSCRDMTGRIDRAKSGEMHLKSGQMKGNVVMTVTDKAGTSRFESASVDLTDDGNTANVKVPSSLLFTSTKSGDYGKRVMVLKGSKGTFVLRSLAEKNDNPLISADVAGPVTITVDERDDKGKVVLYTLTGNTLDARSEGDDKVFTLSGNVHLTSDKTEPDKVGAILNFDVAQATVTVNKDFEVVKVKTKGNGSGTLRDKDGQ